MADSTCFAPGTPDGSSLRDLGLAVLAVIHLSARRSRVSESCDADLG